MGGDFIDNSVPDYIIEKFDLSENYNTYLIFC